MNLNFFLVLLLVSILQISVHCPVALAQRNLSVQSQNQRHCALLPITDNKEGVFAYPLYEQLDKYLKNQQWCEYHASSSVLNLLRKYEMGLNEALREPAVLKEIARILHAGSLVRIALKKDIQRIHVMTEIVSGDAEVLFSEKEVIPEERIQHLAGKIMTYLDLYGAGIPYDGLVVGTSSGGLLIDKGRVHSIPPGSEVLISRVLGKKRHPKLKTIVDWKTQQIGKARVSKQSQDLILAAPENIEQGYRIQAGDWAKIVKRAHQPSEVALEKPPVKPPEMGLIRLAAALSNAFLDYGLTSDRQYEGIQFGFQLEGELWLNRFLFGNIVLGQDFGGLSLQQGQASKTELNASFSELAFTFGYRYLPQFLFFGPQVDLYAGYGRFGQSIERSEDDGAGDGSFGGLLVGLKTDIPVLSSFRFLARVEFSPLLNGYDDQDDRVGDAESTNILRLQAGGLYLLDPRMAILARIQYSSFGADFGSENLASIRQSQFKFLAGVQFGF